MPLKEVLDLNKRDSKEKLESRKLERLKRLLKLRDRDSSKFIEWKEKKKQRESKLKDKLPLLSTRKELNKKNSKGKQDSWK